MGILAALANGFKAVGALFGWAQQRDTEENTPAMQSNSEASQVQAAKDRAAAEIASPDPAALEKDVS